VFSIAPQQFSAHEKRRRCARERNIAPANRITLVRVRPTLQRGHAMTDLFATSLSTCTTRAAAAALFCGLISLTITPAAAVDATVRSACAVDYLTNCSQHPPDSDATRQCMRTLGRNLSPRCIDALASVGEISRAEQARHQKAQRSAAR
jgi:hypothetical protein